MAITKELLEAYDLTFEAREKGKYSTKKLYTVAPMRAPRLEGIWRRIARTGSGFHVEEGNVLAIDADEPEAVMELTRWHEGEHALKAIFEARKSQVAALLLSFENQPDSKLSAGFVGDLLAELVKLIPFEVTEEESDTILRAFTDTEPEPAKTGDENA